MESDCPIPVEVGGKRRRKKVEIAIFDYDQEHTLENLRRVVVCRPEPKNGKKGVTKLRDHQQAAHDLEELKEFMTAVSTCQYGLWTNGLDMFFLRKEQYLRQLRKAEGGLRGMNTAQTGDPVENLGQ